MSSFKNLKGKQLGESVASRKGRGVGRCSLSTASWLRLYYSTTTHAWPLSFYFSMDQNHTGEGKGGGGFFGLSSLSTAPLRTSGLWVCSLSSTERLIIREKICHAKYCSTQRDFTNNFVTVTAVNY
jgi:hypothetical protein